MALLRAALLLPAMRVANRRRGVRYRRLKGAASYPERLLLCGGLRPITGMPLYRRIGAAWGERTPNAARSGPDFAGEICKKCLTEAFVCVILNAVDERALSRWRSRLAWSRAHDWKSCRRHKRLESSNLSSSAIFMNRKQFVSCFFYYCSIS